MGRIDVACGLFFGALSLVFFIGTLGFPRSSIGIDPRSFPRFIIIASFSLSALLTLQGLRKAAKAKGGGEGGGSAADALPRGATALRLLALCAGILVYALVMEALGYILATPFMVALAMYLFGERKPLRILLASILVSALLYLVFRGLFRVPLPRSIIW